MAYGLPQGDSQGAEQGCSRLKAQLWKDLRPNSFMWQLAGLRGPSHRPPQRAASQHNGGLLPRQAIQERPKESTQHRSHSLFYNLILEVTPYYLLLYSTLLMQKFSPLTQ